MFENVPFSLLCLATAVSGTAVPSKSKPCHNSHCLNFNVPLAVDTFQYKPTIPPFTNQFEATEFLVERSGRTPIPPPLSGPIPFKKTFSINVEYCPSTKPTNHDPSTLLLLTHGIGFDKSYWDFLSPGNNSPKNYSFIYHANRAGYPTLSYDRLGIGKSTRANPYSEVQAQVELAVLGELTTLLRAGELNRYGVKRTPKVVHVGHSFGSQLGTGLAASPTLSRLSDAIVNTGYSLATAYQPLLARNSGYHVAALNQPDRFGDESYGYLTWADAVDNQYDFLTWPYFDPAVLRKAEATKWPFAWAEFETGVAVKAPKWNKPVLIVSASGDQVFCGGNCTYDFVVPGAEAAFPLAKPLDVYVQPRTGHGMNLHYNATGWYRVVFDWLEDRGF